MPQIFWGNKPSDHSPKIDGIQYHLVIAVTEKAIADRFARTIRGDGKLARVQKKSITARYGKIRRVIGYCWVVFQAHSKSRRK